MAQAPTLFSLFKTKENIEKLGAQTNLSQQRYLIAWNFSTLLCSIEHPGRAPCFFPSDFCFTSGRRDVQSITTLVEHCPAVKFHEEYHTKGLASYVINSDDTEPSVRGGFGNTTSIFEKKCSVVSSSQVKRPSEDQSNEELCLKPEQCRNNSKIVPHSDQENLAQEPRLRPSHFPIVRHPKDFTMDSQNTWTFNHELNKLDDKNPGALHASEKSVKPGESKRNLVLKNFDNLKRHLMRKCMGDSANILIVKDYWKRAEDSFLTRLSNEIHDLENLIQEYIER